MATDLGIPASEYAPPVGTENNAGSRARAACTRLKTEIQIILREDVPTTAKLTIVYTPAVCTLDLAAETTCVETCEPKTVTVTEYMCQPGYFYGECSAQCTGSCTGSCNGNSVQPRATGAAAAPAPAAPAPARPGRRTAAALAPVRAPATGAAARRVPAPARVRAAAPARVAAAANAQPGCSRRSARRRRRRRPSTKRHTTCESKARFDAVCTSPSVFVTFDVSPHQARVDKLVTAVGTRARSCSRSSPAPGRRLATRSPGSRRPSRGWARTPNRSARRPAFASSTP